jgi:hypothetical protein
LSPCPLCREPPNAVDVHPGLDVRIYSCRRCGNFEADGNAVSAFRNHTRDGWPGNSYLLSGRARNASEEGRVERFHMKDFGAAERGEIPVPDLDGKLRLMLRWFERKSTQAGAWLTPDQSTDYPVAYCKDQHEWHHLQNDVAVPKGWLKHDHTGQQLQLTYDGREWLAKSPPASPPPTKESNVPIVPPHFSQHQAEVDRFVKAGPYEDSVFVMMKFPDEQHMPREIVDMLDSIFAAIRDELDRFGLRARRADDRTFATSRQVWDNLRIYMLGCKYGLAVLEDHSGEELNPNVALEYGFMQALGRDAILLKERGFKHIRADIIGTIPKDFVQVPPMR